ncbi:histone lysine methyltransferase Set9 [Schizosaccharomyces cryophilus OY26]|uniref:Histone-lysine N-methyltransferase SET9 n=1 Tax=Schizosaccharomyces cryophilus (strain OY26 / ATCC MYA-4695 / CBS 11777 / NBRC 106824 / NRRL Y48691) TaxID=653667 RepID=S9VRL6_SCHCR|nr:histone lysine methyltransferase Set9 [Schizosaccharomyces cryophilus OY26]EPY50578.1 histone lysine methyltransferase Set9 [Schizosaccharomyces cryophilus OY26]
MRNSKTQLENFALFDDICTSLFIDKIHYWSEIHKVRKLVSRSIERINSQLLLNIVIQNVIGRKDLEGAIDETLKLHELQPIIQRWSESSYNAFLRHLRLYLSLYLPSCKFEICSTNRYFTSTKHEACVIARELIQAGDDLLDLSGTIVKLTAKEERTLGAEKDFSILHSSRLDAMCLFLGPARFVNHDCDANCRFNTSGRRIWLRSVKPIQPGQEITTFYSSNYFGPDNCECLCSTCERKGINGYRKFFKCQLTSSNLKSISSKQSQQREGHPFSISQQDRLYLSDWDTGSDLSNASDSDLDEELSLYIPRHKKRVWPRERRSIKAAFLEKAIKSDQQVNFDKFRNELKKRRLNGNTEYACSDCQEVFIDSLTRAQGTMCQKCSRHFYLYKLPWPYRSKSEFEEVRLSSPTKEVAQKQHTMSLRRKKPISYNI